MSSEYYVHDTKNKIMFVKLRNIIQIMEYFEKYVILLQDNQDPMKYLNRTSPEFLKRFCTNLIKNIESFVSALEIQNSPDKYSILFSIDNDKSRIQEIMEILKTNSFSNNKIFSLKNYLSNLKKITNIFYGVLNRNQLGVKDNSYDKNDFQDILAELENNVEEKQIPLREYIIKVLRIYYCHLNYIIHRIDHYEKKEAQQRKNKQERNKQQIITSAQPKEILQSINDTINNYEKILNEPLVVRMTKQ